MSETKMPKIYMSFRNNQKAIEVPNGLRTVIRKCIAETLRVTDFVGDVAAGCLTGSDVSGTGKIQLPDFLLQCHFAYELVDKSVHLFILSALCVDAASCGQAY